MTAAIKTPNAPTPLLSCAAGGFEKLAEPEVRDVLLADDGLLVEVLDVDPLFPLAEVSGFAVFAVDVEEPAPVVELPVVLDEE